MDPYKFIGKYTDDILRLFYKCMKKTKTPESIYVHEYIQYYVYLWNSIPGLSK